MAEWRGYTERAKCVKMLCLCQCTSRSANAHQEWSPQPTSSRLSRRVVCTTAMSNSQSTIRADPPERFTLNLFSVRSKLILNFGKSFSESINSNKQINCSIVPFPKQLKITVTFFVNKMYMNQNKVSSPFFACFLEYSKVPIVTHFSGGNELRFLFA